MLHAEMRRRLRPLRFTLALTALSLVLPRALPAQADSIAVWTTALTSGTPSERRAAVDGLVAQTGNLPPSAAQALVAELNRIHAALLAGVATETADDSTEHSGYYFKLVGIVADFRTTESAIALVPAIEVSSGVQRRVARYGGDSAVVLLVDLITRRYSRDDAIETLGLTWFWADSTGNPLSDASRTRIISSLAAAVSSSETQDWLGAARAIRPNGGPAFLALAQALRRSAANSAGAGAYVVAKLDQEIIPDLTASAATRSISQLITSIPQMLAAVCGPAATGERLGVCKSSSNVVGAAAAHYESGQLGPARQEFASVSDRLARAFADGLFSTGEYALLNGDLAALLGRSW